MPRDSFIFYRDWADALKSYPMELKSELFDCIVDFALDGIEDSNKSEITKFIFATFRPKLVRDAEKYATMLERRKESGKKGGLAKASKCYNDLANASKCQQKEANLANLADNDNVNDNVNVNDNDNYNLREEDKSSSSSTFQVEAEVEQVPFIKILNFANDAFSGKAISKVRALSDSRKRSIKARIAQYGIEAIYEVIQKAANSDFLNGNNDRNWIASFDWIMNSNNFCKVLDGNYDNRTVYIPRVNTRDAAGQQVVMAAAQRLQDALNKEENGNS